MSGLRLVWAFLALLLVAPVAAAIPLSGAVRWQEPASVAGIVIMSDAQETVSSLLTFDEKQETPARLIAHGQSVRMVIHEWTEPWMGGSIPEPVHHSATYRSTTRDLTDADLFLTSIDQDPQAVILQSAGPAPPGAPTNVRAAQCLIDAPGEPSRFAFPEDGGLFMESDWKVQRRGDRQLAADCRIDAYESSSVVQTMLYGLTLRVQSPEYNEDIYTGSWTSNELSPESVASSTEPTPGGFDRMYMRGITRILELTPLGTPLKVGLPLRSSAHFYAGEFLVAGELRLGPSEGRLTWGDSTRTGSIEETRAVGEFLLTWGDERYVEVQGTTVDGPWKHSSIVAAAADPVGQAVLVAAAAGGATLLAVLLRALWGLFARTTAGQALDHPRRTRILEFVSGQPGVETTTVARNLGIRWTKVFYHVRRLEQSGHLMVRRFGGRTALFPARVGLSGQEAGLALLRRETPRRIEEAVRGHPDLDQNGIARLLGIHQSQVSRSMRRLVEAGIVRAQRAGRRIVYQAAPAPLEPKLSPA